MSVKCFKDLPLILGWDKTLISNYLLSNEMWQEPTFCFHYIATTRRSRRTRRRRPCRPWSQSSPSRPSTSSKPRRTSKRRSTTRGPSTGIIYSWGLMKSRHWNYLSCCWWSATWMPKTLGITWVVVAILFFYCYHRSCLLL